MEAAEVRSVAIALGDEAARALSPNQTNQKALFACMAKKVRSLLPEAFGLAAGSGLRTVAQAGQKEQTDAIVFVGQRVLKVLVHYAAATMEDVAKRFWPEDTVALMLTHDDTLKRAEEEMRMGKTTPKSAAPPPVVVVAGDEAKGAWRFMC